ncbi:type II toxin-antitoxin system RelE/ParE family toxin [Limosilactobacillus caecicola]|uniref:type II toxin-antitoxin system RelE/ParE family toxin n=1 Tax=Limosilactobacillus caecicola TaxID=2941332 RepID=UPI00283A9F21|nr:type II toxin-antitoxin system RelE/ParE family toxin [Limosilactobacillus caecicola]
MVYDVKQTKRVLKYLKKIKNRQLKRKFVDLIYGELAANPYIGREKKGDLREFYTAGFNYQETTYRVAYQINADSLLIIVILAGSHEGFYEQLKRIK